MLFFQTKWWNLTDHYKSVGSFRRCWCLSCFVIFLLLRCNRKPQMITPLWTDLLQVNFIYILMSVQKSIHWSINTKLKWFCCTFSYFFFIFSLDLGFLGNLFVPRSDFYKHYKIIYSSTYLITELEIGGCCFNSLSAIIAFFYWGVIGGCFITFHLYFNSNELSLIFSKISAVRAEYCSGTMQIFSEDQEMCCSVICFSPLYRTLSPSGGISVTHLVLKDEVANSDGNCAAKKMFRGFK